MPPPEAKPAVVSLRPRDQCSGLSQVSWRRSVAHHPAEDTKNSSPRACDDFLYGFKGAPSARHAYGRNRLRELARATGESRAAGGPVISGKGRRGSRRCWAAAFAAPFGRKPYGATSCRARLPRHRPQPVPAVTAPMPRHTSRARPSRSRRVRRSPCEGHSHRAGTPRIVQVGPSSVKGTRRSFLTASQKGSSGPTLERRSLCRPSGPDGEGQARGQARNARGEPPQEEAGES